MSASFALRPPVDADVPALRALAEQSARDLGIETRVDEADITLMWSTPGFERNRQFRVADAGGELAGWCAYQVRAGRAQSNGHVARAHRGRGIGSTLMAWLLDAVGRHDGVGTIATSANTREPDAIALIESLGFAHDRTFFRMLHPQPAATPEPVWPKGIRVDDTLRGTALLDAIVEGHDGSFIDHWDFVPFAEQREELAHQLTHPEIDPALLFVAFGAGDAVAGINLCFLTRGETFCRGTVGVIGTTRPFRGIGLGRALLRHGVRALAARGATEVTLGVDSQNPSGALGLYRRNGFDVSMETRHYRLALAAAG